MAALAPPVLLASAVALLLALADAGASRCPAGCAGNGGVCNEEVGRCDCPKHLGGEACEVELDLQALAQRCRDMGYNGVESCVSASNNCMNMCSHRGKCVAGFCQCEPGYFGLDCSLSMGPGGKPELLAGKGYTERSRGPRVYMYDLPPHLSSWRNTLRLDRPTTHFFMERLTATGARVADGDTADWYFIPVVLRQSSSAGALIQAIQYIREAHPWWNQTQGHRHFVIATGDMGRVESERGKLAQNVTWATHWGLYKDKKFSGWRASHRNATDIVLPVFLGASKLNRMGIFTSRNHPKFPTKARKDLRERNGPQFFFAGRICGDHSKPRTDGVWPHCATPRSQGYSGGTRQLVHFHHHNRSGFFVQMGDRDYGKHLLTSRFCFGPTGGGHGQRQMQAALAGCVPVIISDGVLEAFEPYLDWGDFGVRLAEADIPQLHKVLEAVGPQEYEDKVRKLRCAAQHMAFSTITGAYMGEDGRFDAFETLLEVLRAKADNPGVPPEQLRRVDPAFDAFMDCREHPVAPRAGDGSGSSGEQQGTGAAAAAAAASSTAGPAQAAAGAGSEGAQAAAGAGSEGAQAAAGAGSEGAQAAAGAGSEGAQAAAGAGSEGAQAAAGAGSEGAQAAAGAGSEGAQAKVSVTRRRLRGWAGVPHVRHATHATHAVLSTPGAAAGRQLAAAGGAAAAAGAAAAQAAEGGGSGGAKAAVSAGGAGRAAGLDGKPRRLCSVSPFDKGDADAVMCGDLMKGRRKLLGGFMCAWSPEELAQCPRPWQ